MANKQDALFWAKVEKSDGCWLWTGYRTKTGYGRLGRKGKVIAAHRYVWQEMHGSIPAGMEVMHKCDMPSCVNPDHLCLGTHDDNMKDMARKLRRADRLTKEAVLAIRAATGTQREIADDFRISQALVSLVRARKVWAHV